MDTSILPLEIGESVATPVIVNSVVGVGVGVGGGVGAGVGVESLLPPPQPFKSIVPVIIEVINILRDITINP